MTSITPATHPHFYYTRALGGHEYFVANYITFEIKRAIDKANIEAFRNLHPEDCKPDVDYDKYNAWVATEDGEIVTNCEAAKILFIPKSGAPPVDFRMMPLAVFNEANRFFERKLPDSTYVPTDVPATAPASIPAA